MDSSLKNELIAGGVDYEDGIDRFGGNEAMFEKFIRRFPDDKHFDDLHAALAEGDSEMAFRHAHSLKGVVGNLSFNQYFEAISPVAELLREGNLAGAIALMPAVKDAHARVLAALEKL